MEPTQEQEVLELERLRAQLLELNHRLVDLLVERDEVVKLVAKRKKLDGIDIVRPEVEALCIADIRAYAEEQGYSPEIACAIFHLILCRAYWLEIMHFQQKGETTS